MSKWRRVVTVDGQRALFIDGSMKLIGGKNDGAMCNIVKHNGPFTKRHFELFATEDSARKMIRENIMPLIQYVKGRNLCRPRVWS